MIDTDHNQSQGDTTEPENPALRALKKAEAMLRYEQAKESGCSTQLPRYQCHKKVWALKIKDIVDPTAEGNESDGSRIIVPEEDGYAPFKVDNAFVSKHKPQVGGYWVQYEDGYRSFSPAAAFEDGYTKI